MRFLRSSRLRSILIIRISAILLMVVFGIGANIYVRARQQIDQITSRIIVSSASLIDQRMEGLLTSAESQGRVLAGILRSWTRSPEASATYPARHLIELMAANPGFSSASLTIEKSGDLIRVQRQADTSLVIQISRIEQGRRYRTDLEPFGPLLRQVRREAWKYEPRQEAHYQQAKAGKEVIWSRSYVIKSPSGLDAPGVTCAVPILDASGRLLGVLSVDFTLNDLSRFLQTVAVGEKGFAFLAERGNDRIKLIAHPDAARILVTRDGVQRIATFSELNDPILLALLPMLAGTPDNPNEISRTTVKVEAENWLVGMKRVSLERSPDWIVAVVVPESDYTQGLREQGIFILVIAAVALMGAIAGSIVLANKVTEPINELIKETEKIRELELSPRELPNSGITEIAALAGSMEQMKAGLRSFQKLVPAEYAKWLLKSGHEARLGGERRHMTISFADLIGFTSLSESVSPEKLSEILAQYLEVLSRQVVLSQGTVDKFNGDDVMSFWGAPSLVPEHAILACQAAMKSREELESRSLRWLEQGIPRLRVSWGISTGDVVVGNVGSQDRMNYTVIGDTVNLASRLQGINRVYETEILISSATRAACGDKIVSRMVDWVVPLGKENAVEIHELIGLTGQVDPVWDDVLDHYEKAINLMATREWVAAEEHLFKVLNLRPEDGPSRVMIARLGRYRVKPPEPDWDGSFRIGSK